MRMNFYFLTADNYELRQKENQIQIKPKKIFGKIKDMSSGGIKVEIEKIPPEGIKKGDFFFFHLPFASLRGNLAVSAVNVVSLNEKTNIHMMFRDLDMLTHIKLNQYLNRKKLRMKAA